MWTFAAPCRVELLRKHMQQIDAKRAQQADAAMQAQKRSLKLIRCGAAGVIRGLLCRSARRRVHVLELMGEGGGQA
jgi:hypothetical protein